VVDKYVQNYERGSFMKSASIQKQLKIFYFNKEKTNIPKGIIMDYIYRINIIREALFCEYTYLHLFRPSVP
jgi:hypothetical protein